MAKVTFLHLVLQRKRSACSETNVSDSNSSLDCGFVKFVFVAVYGFFLGYKLGENHHLGFIKQDPLLPKQKTDSAQFRKKSLRRLVKKMKEHAQPTIIKQQSRNYK